MKNVKKAKEAIEEEAKSSETNMEKGKKKNGKEEEKMKEEAKKTTTKKDTAKKAKATTKKPAAMQAPKQVASEETTATVEIKNHDEKPAKSEEKAESAEKTTVEEIKEEPMAKPAEINGKTHIDPKTKKRHRRLFSPALFKESLKSNKLGLSVVSAGNALIMIVIISILSTLHINATADAMKDLFGNADQESSVKSGAVSMYSSFYNTASAYEQFQSSEETLDGTVTKSIAMVNDSTTNSLMSALSTGYKTSYDAAVKAAAISGTTIDKEALKTQIKKIASDASKDTISANTSMSDQEKSVACFLVDRYLDIYAEDTSKTTETILKACLPQAFADEIQKEQTLDKKGWETVYGILNDAFVNVYTDGKAVAQVAQGSAFKLMRFLANGETEEFVVNTIDTLESLYNADPEAYLADSTIQQTALSSACVNYVVDETGSRAYYAYLPTFTVEYVTSDRGYPITYKGTGEYGSNGEEIMEQIEVMTYNPDVYVQVKGDMGTKANLVEKMHKEVITGEPYSDSEIALAKEEAKGDVETLNREVTSFMNDYLDREDGKNEYYDGSSINEKAIADRAVSIVSEEAEKTIIESYNESHIAKVEKIEQITALNNSMDGEEMMSLVQGYASSGIASYKTHLANALEKGYSQEDSVLIANVKASKGVIDQLPAGVASALEEMGEMNTYGIVVGVVAFGIAALLIPMVYTILTANALVAEKVETGSLAFTLSTPTPRSCYVFTEGVYLLFTEIVMGVALFVAALLTREIGILCGSADLTTSLPISDIAAYAFGNFSVTIAVSGICFLSSCYFNKTPKAIGVGGGLTIFFFICSILGLFGTTAIPATVRIDAMNLFNYMTIDSCFDAMSVMNQDWVTYWWKISILYGIAIATYGLADLKFIKKDLPL